MESDKQSLYDTINETKREGVEAIRRLQLRLDDGSDVASVDVGILGVTAQGFNGGRGAVCNDRISLWA